MGHSHDSMPWNTLAMAVISMCRSVNGQTLKICTSSGCAASEIWAPLLLCTVVIQEPMCLLILLQAFGCLSASGTFHDFGNMRTKALQGQ